jgi:hypothetical protein
MVMQLRKSLGRDFVNASEPEKWSCRPQAAATRSLMRVLDARGDEQVGIAAGPYPVE